MVPSFRPLPFIFLFRTFLGGFLLRSEIPVPWRYYSVAEVSDPSLAAKCFVFPEVVSKAR